jgi:peroxiredoxin
MRRMLIPILCLAMYGAMHGAVADTAESWDLPERVTNFQLLDAHGASHDLYRHSDAKGVVLFFQGNGCPIVRQSFIELKNLRDAYAEKGIVFLQINANPQDTRKEVLEEMADFDMDIPVLLDERQSVTRMLGVNRTAEAIVITPQRWRIVYRGAMDDRFDYGTRRPEAQNEYLKDAIDALLAGKDPEPAMTETKGCLIHLRPEPEQVSYVHDVAPIIAEKCVTCHAPGRVGPFALASHRDVDGWTRMIEEVLLTKRMPPWNADPHIGRFANDWTLTAEEERTLLAWLRAGAPRDEGDDPLIAAAEKAAVPATAHNEHPWTLGEPDVVVSLPRPIEIPADGLMPYAYVTVRPELEEDVWVTATEIIPTDHGVTHHALVFVSYPAEYKHLERDVKGGLEGYFAAFVPGQGADPFPEGTGKFLPKGSTLVFQMHYTPNGKATTDQTVLGLHTQRTPPANLLDARSVYNNRVRIPPHADEHTMRASYTLEEDIVLHGMWPHMHYRGKHFAIGAILPDGDRVPLLSVPRYDFNWQILYRLEEPMFLPAGTRIVCTGAHDNSVRNPANPDPDAWVTFGEQTYDEMFVGYLVYALVNERPADWVAGKKK